MLPPPFKYKSVGTVFRRFWLFVFSVFYEIANVAIQHFANAVKYIAIIPFYFIFIVIIDDMILDAT